MIIENLKDIPENEMAADSLPMRMVVATIAMGALIILLSCGLHSLLEKEESYAAEAVISEIESHAGQMSAKGTGSIVTLDIDIPANTRIIMGAIPGKKEAWPADSGNYYMEMNGKQVMGESVVFYANSTLDGCFTIGPGTHTIGLKSVRDQNGKIFITLDDKSQP